jgi:hypothetical protein
VNGVELLDEIASEIEAYVILPCEAKIAVTLWIMHAHAFEASTISPRLVITSPEKRCGKTTLTRVLQALVPKPLSAANITAAALFQTVFGGRPTDGPGMQCQLSPVADISCHTPGPQCANKRR